MSKKVFRDKFFIYEDTKIEKGTKVDVKGGDKWLIQV